MPTLEQMMQNLPLSTDITTQEELNTGISNLSTTLIGTSEDAASADTINGSKKYAKEYANSVIDTIISGAPQAFDTLKEIADWISSDETSSAKLISDIIDLQKNVASVSNDLSIDVSRVIVTENDGYQQGESMGILGGFDLTNFFGTRVQPGNENAAACFALSSAIAIGWTLAEIEAALSDTAYSENEILEVLNAVYAPDKISNGPHSILSSIEGYYDGFGDIYCSWIAENNTVGWFVKGSGELLGSENRFELPIKAIELHHSQGTQTVFRKPILFFAGIDSLVIYEDYDAVPKTKTTGYADKVSATYATKNELTGFVDLTSNQNIAGTKTFNVVKANIVQSDLSASNEILVGDKLEEGNYALINAYGIDTQYEAVRTAFSNNNKDVFTPVRKFYLEDLSTDYVQNRSCEWKFPEIENGKTFVFADRDFVLSTLSSNGSSAISDIYVLSGEVVEGLSNTVIPKLSTIADLVSSEVERVDEISGKLSNAVTESDLAEYLPLSGGIVTGDVELSSASLTLSKHIGFESKTRMATLDFDGNAVTLSSSPSSVVNINMALKNNETLFNNLSVVSTVINGNTFKHTNDKFIANGTTNVVEGYVVAINGNVSAITGGSGYSGIGTAINAIISGNGNVAIGGNNFSDYSIIGNNSTLINSTIGNPALSGNGSVSIGHTALFGNNSIAFSNGLLVGNKSIGMLGRVSADCAIQLGDHLVQPNWNGNTEASSFNVFQYKMLDKDGLIPDARLCSNIVRNSEISNFITQNDLSDCLKLTGGTMDGPIYSGENTGLGLKNSVLIANNVNARLCATYAVHGDEEYLLNNAEEGKTILITFESLFPYSTNNNTITPLDLSVLGGLQTGTYELSFVYDPDYDGYTDQGLVWEYRLSDENNNFGIFIGKEDYPGIAEVYKYFSLDVYSKLKVPGDEDLDLWFTESETFDLEHKKILYGEVSPLASQKYVDDKFANYVPLSVYQALELRVATLESRLSDIETIVDQINGNN